MSVSPTKCGTNYDRNENKLYGQILHLVANEICNLAITFVYMFCLSFKDYLFKFL